MNNIVKRLVITALVVLIGASLALYLRGASMRKSDAEYHAGLANTLQVTSGDFAAGGNIPARFTCLGPGQSPELEWKNGPANAMSYAVLVVDFDAPAPKFAINAFTHWMVYDIPPDQHALAGAAKTKSAYVPPCPPLGQHAYVFRVYALDLPQLQPAPEERQDLLNAMRGHIVAYGELVGRFRRP